MSEEPRSKLWGILAFSHRPKGATSRGWAPRVRSFESSQSDVYDSWHPDFLPIYFSESAAYVLAVAGGEAFAALHSKAFNTLQKDFIELYRIVDFVSRSMILLLAWQSRPE